VRTNLWEKQVKTGRRGTTSGGEKQGELTTFNQPQGRGRAHCSAWFLPISPKDGR